MLYLTTEGPDRQRGVQHGRTFGAQIRRALEHARWTDGSSAGEREASEAMWAWVNDHQPWLAQEITGIGQGAELPIDAVRHLSLFSATRQFGECTTLGFCDSDRGPILAKTFDIGAQRDVYLLHRARPMGGYSFLRVSWAGNVWAPTGINEAGLAVGGSSTPAVPDQDPYAMPWHMTLNPVLRECATAADAVALLASMDLAGRGHNYAIMDEQGDGALVQKCGDRQAVITPERDVICGTNHYTTPEFEDMPAPTGDAGHSSLARLAWMRETFIDSSDRPRPTLKGLIDAVRHDEGDGRLCRKGFLGGHTHYAMVYVCRERTMLVSDGYPCETQFVPHTV